MTSAIPAAAILIALGISVGHAGEEPGAQFRGYAALNNIVKERIVASPDFDLGKKLDPEAPSVNGLVGLLGTYKGFRNGQPNAINMLIGYLSLYDLAKEIGRSCGKKPRPGSRIELRPAFSAALARVCEWPKTGARQDAALSAFWGAMTAFDAPPEEFEKWRARFSSAEYARSPASGVVTEMIMGALYSPYFLLKG